MPQASRPVLGGRLARRARPEEHDLVAGAAAVAAEVDDELVHADPAADRPALAVDQTSAGVAGVARDAVAVPERDQADAWCRRAAVQVWP